MLNIITHHRHAESVKGILNNGGWGMLAGRTVILLSFCRQGLSDFYNIHQWLPSFGSAEFSISCRDGMLSGEKTTEDFFEIYGIKVSLIDAAMLAGFLVGAATPSIIRTIYHRIHVQNE